MAYRQVEKRSTFFPFAIPAALLLIAIARASGDSLPDGGIRIQAETPKKEYLPGEPVLVTLLVTNDSNDAQSVYLPDGGDAAFDVSISDSNGIPLMRGTSRSEGMDVYDTMPLKIPPKASERQSFVLNRRCSTMVAPGYVNVECGIKFVLPGEQRSVDMGGGQRLLIPIPMHAQSVTLRLKILPADPNAYRNILADLSRKAEQLRTSGLYGPRAMEAAIGSVEMLAFAEGNEAVPYQLALLRDIHESDRTRFHALESLERNASAAAATGVIAMVEERDYWWSFGNERLVLAVYKMRERGGAEVRKLTEKFVSTHPKPPEVTRWTL